MTITTIEAPPRTRDSEPAAPLPSAGDRPRDTRKIPVLDGWRGISILSVLATHMLPLGPGGWGNRFIGQVGMSLFFTLSGFLITGSLLERLDVVGFFIRRACRILPLAFAYATVA